MINELLEFADHDVRVALGWHLDGLRGKLDLIHRYRTRLLDVGTSAGQ